MSCAPKTLTTGSLKPIMADPRNVKDFIKEFLPREVSREIDLTHMKQLPTERMNKNAKYCMNLAVECDVGGEKNPDIFHVRAQILSRRENIASDIRLHVCHLGGTEKEKISP